MKRYNILRLKSFGVFDNLNEKADTLHEISWLKSKCVYPEAVEVLEYFKGKGYETRAYNF